MSTLKVSCGLYLVLAFVVEAFASNSSLLSEENCPVGFIRDSNSCCICWYGDAIWCDQPSQKSYLKVGYCMSYGSSDNMIYFGKCPYTNWPVTTYHQQYISLPSNVSELNELICGSINREGLLCSKCKEGFGIGLYSYGFQCVRCKENFPGWTVYFILELFPVSVFFLVIMFFRINTVSPPINGYVLFCQFFVLIVNYDNPIRAQLLNSKSSVTYFVAQILLLLCSIWTLDFFSFIIPPFCVSPGIKNIHALMFHYISAFYPLILIAVSWICIELHDRNFRPLVWMWSPFHKCFARCRRRWNPKASAIDAFATFLQLSYVKLVYMSFYLYANEMFVISIGSGKYNYSSFESYIDPSFPLFAEQHLPFLIPTIVSAFLFVIVPSLLLCLYPIKIFRKICSFRFLHCDVLHAFVEKFHGSYKDGTNGTRDYRFISAPSLPYIIYYIIADSIHSPLFKLYGFDWILASFVSLSTAHFVALLRPYKVNCMNVLESLIFALLGTLALIVYILILGHKIYWTEAHISSPHTILTFFLLLAAIPHTVFIGYIVYRLLKFMGVIQHIKVGVVNYFKPQRLETMPNDGHNDIRDDQSETEPSTEVVTDISDGMTDPDVFTPLLPVHL